MSAQRMAQWLWWSGAAPARVARGVLLPFAFAYRTLMSARAGAYRKGWLRQRPLPLPAVAIGNLAVGGAGKTPLAAWTAAFFARRGARPGVLLRGYRGGDEQAVHQRLVPQAIVVANPNRLAGAAEARNKGARVLVLDDAYQRLNVGRDVNIAVVSTESSPPRHVAWPLPAGPWREDWSASGRGRRVASAGGADRGSLAVGRCRGGPPGTRWHGGAQVWPARRAVQPRQEARDRRGRDRRSGELCRASARLRCERATHGVSRPSRVSPRCCRPARAGR